VRSGEPTRNVIAGKRMQRRIVVAPFDEGWNRRRCRA